MGGLFTESRIFGTFIQHPLILSDVTCAPPSQSARLRRLYHVKSTVETRSEVDLVRLHMA